MYIHSYTHVHICVYECAICVCMFIYTWTCMSIHLHIYTYAHSGISPAKHSPSWELKANNGPKSGSVSHRRPSISSRLLDGRGVSDQVWPGTGHTSDSSYHLPRFSEQHHQQDVLLNKPRVVLWYQDETKFSAPLPLWSDFCVGIYVSQTLTGQGDCWSGIIQCNHQPPPTLSLIETNDTIFFLKNKNLP